MITTGLILSEFSFICAMDVTRRPTEKSGKYQRAASYWLVRSGNVARPYSSRVADRNTK